MKCPMIPRRTSRAYITGFDGLPGRKFAVWWSVWVWRGKAYRKRRAWMEVTE